MLACNDLHDIQNADKKIGRSFHFLHGDPKLVPFALWMHHWCCNLTIFGQWF